MTVSCTTAVFRHTGIVAVSAGRAVSGIAAAAADGKAEDHSVWNQLRLVAKIRQNERICMNIHLDVFQIENSPGNLEVVRWAS